MPYLRQAQSGWIEKFENKKFGLLYLTKLEGQNKLKLNAITH